MSDLLPRLSLGFDELIVDNFAGGGGASTGIQSAVGRAVDIAINHDEQAIAMHTVNHPQAQHYIENVWDVDPRKATKGRPVGLAWFSPDCRHFSKAKGKVPVSPSVRGLAWVVMRWVGTVRPRVVMLENVEEFQSWGPVVKSGGGYKPCEKRKGQTFRSFINALKRHGYEVDTKEIRACDYGAPTIRKRLFLIARCDGEPIVWPDPTHGPGLIPYRPAADIIDWSIPVNSIFDRKRPLAEKTLQRIAKGIGRFVYDDPFVVDDKAAFLTECANGSSQRVFDINEPLRTQVAKVKGGHFALCTAFLTKYLGGSRPLPGRSDQVNAYLMKYYKTGAIGQSLNDPAHSIRTKQHLGLVVVKGENYRISDIGLRMLQPSELFAAQGFRDDYQFEFDVDGNRINKTEQVAKCGNSVCPPVVEALVRANFYQDNDARKAA